MSNSSDDLNNTNVFFKKLFQIASFENLLMTKNQMQLDTVAKSNGEGYLATLDFLTDINSYFTINNNYSFKTVIGGLLSILLILLIAPVIYFIGRDFWLKTNPLTSSIYSDLNEIKQLNLTYDTSQSFIHVAYYEKQLDKDMVYIIHDNTADKLPIDSPDTCTESQLLSLFSKDEIKESNVYKCHTLETFYPKFRTQKISDVTYMFYQHKCINQPELMCQPPSGTFNVGFRMNYTTPLLDKYEDFLESAVLSEDLQREFTNFPYAFFFLQYNILKNDVGVFQEMLEEYNYLTIVRKGLRRSGQWQPTGTFEGYFQLNNDLIIYTRKYKLLTAVIRESFSILLLISTIFKLITVFVSNFYCEQYLIDFFIDNKIFKKQINESIEQNNNCNSDSENHNNQLNNKQNIEMKNKDEQKMYNNYVSNYQSDNTIKGTANNVSNNKIYYYTVSLKDYAFNLFPLTKCFANNGYVDIKNKIDERLSVETIIS